MEAKKNRKSVRSVTIKTVVLCLLIGIGVLVVYKTKSTDNTATLKMSTSQTDIFGNEDSTYTTETFNADDDNPLNHLRLLQKDVEEFKALMEEVKRELFATET